MLNAELKSMNSILTYESFLSRCVRAGWRAVAMASSVERLDLYANWKGSKEGGRTDLMCCMTSRSRERERVCLCERECVCVCVFVCERECV